MEDENVEVAPSEDQGNVPLDAPSEPVEEVAPAVEEPAPPTEPELFELPDGRKVDAETLSKEWKENFYPEFTRKSQELAAVKAPKINSEATAEDPYADPSYVPKSYREILDAAKQAALQEIEGREQAAQEARQAVEQEVVTQLNEIKKADPTLDENALFLHANKYQFRDLKLAHDNMRAMAELTKTVQKNTIKAVAKRADAVSVNPGATGAKSNPSNFQTAAEYLRSLK